MAVVSHTEANFSTEAIITWGPTKPLDDPSAILVIGARRLSFSQGVVWVVVSSISVGMAKLVRVVDVRGLFNIQTPFPAVISITHALLPAKAVISTEVHSLISFIVAEPLFDPCAIWVVGAQVLGTRKAQVWVNVSIVAIRIAEEGRHELVDELRIDPVKYPRNFNESVGITRSTMG